MTPIPQHTRALTRSLTFALTVCILATTSAFSQTTTTRQYDIELMVNRGKKTVPTDAVLTLNDNGLVIEPKKRDFAAERREFLYTDIKTADYSFAKKPVLSTGGAVAVALLVSVFIAVPLLFVKKKRHWLAIQGGPEQFAVLKLYNNNHRQVVADLKARGVSVSELKEEGK